MDLRPAVVTVLALVAITASSLYAGAQPRIEEVPEGVSRLLDDRGRAYVEKSRDLLSATLAGPLRDREMESFDNARDVPFSVYRFTPVTRYSGNVAGRRIRSLHPGLDVRTYHVMEESAVAGVETVPFVEDAFFTFGRSAPDSQDPYDGWRMVSTTDLEALGIFSPHHLWDAGPVSTASSDHFVVLAHPDRVEDARAFLPEAEQAMAEVRAWWPRPIASQYVLIVPSSTEELGDLFQATVDLTKFVAFAAGSVRREGGWEPAGVRMYVNPPNFDRYNAEGRTLIFAHELIHAITRPLTGPFIPSWVEEGLAQVASEGDTGLDTARRGPTPTRFPVEEDFFVGPTADIVRTYRQAQAGIQILVDRGGVEQVARLYETLGAARVAAGTDDYHVRAAVSQIGWSYDEWLEAWTQKLG